MSDDLQDFKRRLGMLPRLLFYISIAVLLAFGAEWALKVVENG